MQQLMRYACAIGAALTLAGSVHAQQTRPGVDDDFPNKPIRLVVPSAPGGGTDIIARLVAQGLNDSWGQSVVVDNRGGAGGIPGVTSVAKASNPDGYTMLLGSVGHLSFAPAIYPKLAYDPERNLRPISLVASQPFIVAVHPSLPVSSIKELIAYAKSRPGTISYASGGSGSATHLGTELLQLLAGISMLHVPYKGSAPGMSALMGGEVQLCLGGVATVLPHAKSGKARALAVTGAKRSPAAPELPTVAEAGVLGYEFDVWYGLVVPGGTPRAIVMKTNAEIVRLLKSPVVGERFAAAGLEPRSSTPEEFADLLRREIPRWQNVVKTANIRLD